MAGRPEAARTTHWPENARARLTTLRATAARASARDQLLALLGLGLVLRLALSPIGAFEGDHAALRLWAARLVTDAPWHFYDQGFSDQLPGQLWLIGVVGWFYHLVTLGGDPAEMPRVFLKLVPALADVAAGALLFASGRRLAGSATGLLAAALYTFNPATLWLTAIWGQWDTPAIAVALLALWLLLRGRPEWALPVMTAAALMRPLFALLLPLLILWFVLRWVIPHTGWAIPRDTPPEPWPMTRRRTVVGVAAAMVTALVLMLPFNVGPSPLPTTWTLGERLGIAFDAYPLSSVNAFTLWWPLLGNWQPDSQRILGLSAATWGMALLVLAVGVALVGLWRKASNQALVTAMLAVLLAGFVLPTRVHERDVLPAVALATLVAALVPRLRWVAVALSLTAFANLYWVYSFYQPAPRPGLLDTDLFPGMLALVNLALLGAVLAHLLGLPLPAVAASVANPALPARPLAPAPPAPPVIAPPPLPGAPPDTIAPSAPATTTARPWERAWLAGTILIPLGLIAVALLLRLPNLADPGRMYFDEVYFVTTAQGYAAGNPEAHIDYQLAPYGSAWEWTHPPLGKLLIAASILIVGDEPFGWRFAGALFGAAGAVVAFLIGLTLTGRLRVATLTAVLLLADGLYLVMTRTGTVDAFVVVFTMSALLAFYGVLTAPPDRVAWPLLRTGALMGLGLATKWNTAYAAGLIGVVALVRGAYILWRWWRQRGTEEAPAAWRALRAHLIWGPIGLVVVPVAVYLLAYLPFFRTGHTWEEFIRISKRMYTYHAGVQPSHVYRSEWWEWPLGLGRMWFYSNRADGLVYSIYTNVNPILAWSFVPAAAWVAWRWWRVRPALVTVLVIGFFGQWLSWYFSPRPEAFIYHFLPAVPWGCLALAMILDRLWRADRARRWLAVAFILLAVGFQLFFYPMTTAQPMTEARTSMRADLDDWWRETWE